MADDGTPTAPRHRRYDSVVRHQHVGGVEANPRTIHRLVGGRYRLQPRSQVPDLLVVESVWYGASRQRVSAAPVYVSDTCHAHRIAALNESQCTFATCKVRTTCTKCWTSSTRCHNECGFEISISLNLAITLSDTLSPGVSSPLQAAVPRAHLFVLDQVLARQSRDLGIVQSGRFVPLSLSLSLSISPSLHLALPWTQGPSAMLARCVELYLYDLQSDQKIMTVRGTRHQSPIANQQPHG